MRKFERPKHEINLEELELDECQRLVALNPIEGLILICTSDRRFDLGALCYEGRVKSSRAVPKTVQKDSLRPERCLGFRNWVIGKITDYYGGGSGYTTYSNTAEMNRFVTWCDENGHEAFLVSAIQYQTALRAFTQHLCVEIKKGNIVNFTGNRLQSEALRSAPVFFPKSPINFLDDLPLISNKDGNKNPTKAPTKTEIEKFLTPCQYLFDGLTEFLVKNISFPHRIAYCTEYLWLLPAEYPFASQNVRKRRKIENYIFWDYENGRVRTLTEAQTRTKQADFHIIRQINEALQLLDEANINLNHTKRIRLAKLAHDAFLALFVANTGLNETPVRNLPWSGNYTITESTQQGFATIKVRAGNREVSISIKKTFVKHFEKYLTLREYICKGIDHPFLFVGMTNQGTKIGGKLLVRTIFHFNNRIRSYIGPDFIGLNYQKLRKYKSTYLLSKRHPLQVVSALMQTSESTILKVYAEANEKTAIDEIGAMMNHLVSLLDDYSGEDNPAGDCADADHRGAAMAPPEGYEPNCKNFEGCIYCSQFRIHADEESIRKLLSMRHFILEFLGACTDFDQFKRIHSHAIDQIERIINTLTTARPEMKITVEKIQNEIQQHFKLTRYWERLYERLLKLRVMK